jgi:hypothetical protein
MGASGTFQGKGRGFRDRGGSFSVIRAPRRNRVKREGAQFRWIERSAAAASETEPNSRRNGLSQIVRYQKTGAAIVGAAIV